MRERDFMLARSYTGAGQPVDEILVALIVTEREGWV